MSSGLFTTHTPTAFGIPQSDGSGFINPEWLLTNGSGTLQNNGFGGLSWSVLPVGGDMFKADNLSGLANYSTARSNLGLGSVENTALSTWAGSTNLTTLGTISAGVWHGTSIADSYIASASTWNAKMSAFTPGNSLAFTGSVLDTIQDIRVSSTPQFTRLGVGQIASATVAVAVTGTTSLSGACMSVNGNLVVGASAISNPAAFKRMLQIQDSSAVFSFRDPTGTPQQYDFGLGDPAGIGNKDYGVYDASAGVWIMVLQQTTGNVGIGITNPASKLHINGAIKTSNPSGGTAQPIKFGSIVTATSVFDTTRYLQGEVNGTAVKLALCV